MKNIDKTLLILDLDETLVFATAKMLDRSADFEIFDYHVYKRPYLNDFLQQVKEHFLLAIWSSASDDYVQKVVEQIIPKEIKLEFVWGSSRCTYQRNLQIDEYGYYDSNQLNHYHYIKPLRKLKRKNYTLNRILIVDDSPHKSKANYGNVIYPAEYTGDEHDHELKLLAQYLISLKDEDNVRRIEKRNWRYKVDS